MSTDIRPSVFTLINCFFRSYLVAAAFNTRGMQNVGFLFVMEPGLKHIYPDPVRRREARKRYLRHYNTHMFWTPLLTGMFLTLETQIAGGLFPSKVLEHVKNTTVYTLSAIGDSVFGGSLIVFWSLSTCIFLVEDMRLAAIIWAGAWFTALQLFKAATFIMGFRDGLKFLHRLKSWDLINWGGRIKKANAVLATIFLYSALPESYGLVEWVIVVGLLITAGWGVSRLHVSREIIALLIPAAYAFRPWIMQLWSGMF